MRPIDADEINYTTLQDGFGRVNTCIAFADDIDAMPTLDVIPAKRGEWIDEGQYGVNFAHHVWRCSECGEHVTEIDVPWYKHCPNCGAFMGDK